MNKIINFGENVQGYSIPVLNEREIRAAAGILFVLMFLSIFLGAAKSEFTLLKYAITIFLADISIRVFINPRFSPTLIMGRWIVRNQTPEYVGAKQKKFAWIIGFVLATSMFVHLVILNGISPITGIICLICLIFLFFETSFGICIGCKVYKLIYKENAQYCPGEVCEIKDRHEIQKTSKPQALILLGLVVFITLTVVFFGNNYSQKPYDIFGLEKSAQVRSNFIIYLNLS